MSLHVSSLRYADIFCPAHLAAFDDLWPFGENINAEWSRCGDCCSRVGGQHYISPFSNRTLDECIHRVAHHEAGHAVADVLEGWTVNTLAIEINSMDEVSGHVLAEAPAERTLSGSITLWAGKLAGLRWMRSHGWESVADRVDDLATCLSDDLKLRSFPEAHVRAGKRIARQMVDEHWSTICQVAFLLADRRELPGQVAHDVVRSAGGVR